MGKVSRSLAALVIAGNLFNLLTAVVIGLAMPLCVSVETYAGYRTYTLYIGYVGLFHLGFVNGMALRYGQLDYARLPFDRFRGFTRVQIASQFLAGLVLFAAAGGLGQLGDISRMSPMLFVTMNLFASNLRHYYSVVDRFSGRFKADAVSLILYDAALLTGFSVLLARKPDTVQPFLLFITCLNLVMVLGLALVNREITFGRPVRCSATELLENVRRGSRVMMGEMIGGLVLGIDSIFVQLFFGTGQFSAYAFAAYIITAACTALSAGDNLIFPALKRQAPEKLGESYRKLLRIVLLASALMLLPVGLCLFLIPRFLPMYTGSVSVLAILCPALVLRSLCALACRNILLVLDRENVFMRNNAAALVLGFLLDLAVVLFRGSIQAIAVVSVVTFAVWFLLNDRAVQRALG